MNTTCVEKHSGPEVPPLNLQNLESPDPSPRKKIEDVALRSILKGSAGAPRPFRFPKLEVRFSGEFDKVRLFHVTEDGRRDMFSLCRYFPHISSEEEAEVFLAGLREDPYISPYIPEDDRLTAVKKLTVTYEKIKFDACFRLTDNMSLSLMRLCSIYLGETVPKSPELLEDAMALLEANPRMWQHLDRPKEGLFASVFLSCYEDNQTLFPKFRNILSDLLPWAVWDGYLRGKNSISREFLELAIRKLEDDPEILNACPQLEKTQRMSILFTKVFGSCFDKQGALLPSFLETLLGLVPLQEVAKLRSELDELTIARSLGFPRHSQGLKKELEFFREELTSPRGLNTSILDLSGLTIGIFPKELAEKLRHIRKVDLRASQGNLADMFKGLAELPNLRSIDLSSNQIDADVLNSLLGSIKRMKHLGQIDLYDTPIIQGDVADFVQYCQEKGIALNAAPETLPVDKAEAAWNMISSRFGQGTEIGELTQLDLSGLPIEAIPVQLPVFCQKITSVTLNGSQASVDKILEMVRVLLQFPSLEEIILQGNKIDAAALGPLLSIVQESGRQLKKIDLSKNLFDPTLPFYRKAFKDRHHISEFVHYCSENNIDLVRSYFSTERDLVLILEAIQKHMQANGIEMKIPTTFVGADELMAQVSEFLETHKSSLQMITRLDLSGKDIHTLHPSLAAHLPNVKSLFLRGSYPEHVAKSSVKRSHSDPVEKGSALLQIPSLEMLDLSQNFLTPMILLELSNLVQNPESKLTVIDLSNCRGDESELDKFQSLCSSKKVRVLGRSL